MDYQSLILFLTDNPTYAFLAAILASIVGFFIARWIIGRALVYLSERTETTTDDIIVKNLRPFRVAWLVPLLTLYSFAYLIPEFQTILEKSALLLILLVSASTINSMLNAINEIYETSENYSGVSIQSYIDIVKILIILIGLILMISLLTGESPTVLLSGLGALTAVLLLVFRDTILSLVASIQMTTNNLVKEGDWIEAPSYGADGAVINISLHAVKIQNWNKTITVIPTHKMIDMAYKNWRGMEESGGRRIKRSINIDQSSIQFCDREMFDSLKQNPMIEPILGQFEKAIDHPADERPITNVEIFRSYIVDYLKNRGDMHTSPESGLTFLVRALSPSPIGLPIEIYAFTKTTAWAAYESIQAEIFDHLIAAAPAFELRLFQQPTGTDFSTVLNR